MFSSIFIFPLPTNPKTPSRFFRLNCDSILTERLRRFGVTFIGPANSEGVLLKVASVFEQLTKARDLKRPFLVPKAELSDPSGHDGFLAKAWRLFFGG